MRNIKDNDKALLEGLVSKYGRNNVLAKVNSLNENANAEVAKYFNDSIKDILLNTGTYEEAKEYYHDSIDEYVDHFDDCGWSDKLLDVFRGRMEKAFSTYDNYKKYLLKYRDEIEQGYADVLDRMEYNRQVETKQGRTYYNAHKLIDPILKSGCEIKFNGKPIKFDIDYKGDINVTF